MDDPTELDPMPVAPAEPPPLPVWPTATWRPPLRPAMTILCWVAVGLCSAVILTATITGSHLDYLDHPAADVIAVGEKDLDLDAAIRAAPAWEQTLYRLLGYSSEDSYLELADGYRRVADYLDGLGPGVESPPVEASLRARLVILEAEHGDAARMNEAIAGLPSTGPAERFIDAVRYAYDGTAPRQAPEGGDWDLSVLTAGDPRIDQSAWSRDRLRERLAERDGDAATAARLRDATLQRGGHLVRRGRALETVYCLTLLAGLGAILVWLPRWRHSMAVANGIVVAPWSLHYGFAVIARCVAAAGALSFVLWGPLYLWATLTTALPMLFLMHYFLFRPDHTTFWSGFGLSPGTLSWKGLILFGLALTTVDQLGCLLIQNGAELAGLAPLWEEGIDETLLFGSLPAALASAVDGVIWAPLFEELAFRGLLYVTLRTRLTPVPAALLSGSLFGVVHLYSLAGFVEVAWTGFILALGYEKCRSLWPCIFAHCFNNLFYFGALLAVYR